MLNKVKKYIIPKNNMKAKPCELYIGTYTNFFKFGEFESIRKAKKYVKECITCYHEIRVK